MGGGELTEYEKEKIRSQIRGMTRDELEIVIEELRKIDLDRIQEKLGRKED